MQPENKIKAFILDDEQDAIDALCKIIAFASPHIEVVGSTCTIEEAYHAIIATKPDLVFLDINIKNRLSFELLDLFDNIPFKVIFITGHDEYAIKAIKYAALDYIMKPVNSVELMAAVKKVSHFFHTKGIPLIQESVHHDKKLPGKIALAVGNEINIVAVESIIYCESDGNFTYVSLMNGSRLYVSQSIKELDFLLTEKGFFRVHKSFLINMFKVKKYNQKSGEEVIMENDVAIPIAVRKKQEFLSAISSLF